MRLLRDSPSPASGSFLPRTRHILPAWALCTLLWAAACAEDEPGSGKVTTRQPDAGDGDGDATAGDGDGDGDAQAGDGDAPAGDGDAGGGDGDTTGGDGDSQAGDGDGNGDVDAGGNESSCFRGDSTPTGTGAGDCADPTTLDLTAGAIGDSYRLPLAGGGTADEVSALGKCGATAVRRWVVVLRLPTDEPLDVELAVQGADGHDVTLRVHGAVDDTCAAMPVRCADDGVADFCEYVRARRGEDFGDSSLQLVVSELQASGEPPVLHVRLAPPGTGA